MQTFIKEDVQKYWDTIIKCLFHNTWHIETYECGMFQEMQIISCNGNKTQEVFQ